VRSSLKKFLNFAARQWPPLCVLDATGAAKRAWTAGEWFYISVFVLRLKWCLYFFNERFRERCNNFADQNDTGPGRGAS
jgi:hypothetical protein